MPITKYILNTSDRWNHLATILQENAMDYFDSVTISGDHIVCSVDGSAALELNIDSSYNNAFRFTVKNGNSQSMTTVSPISYVVVTSNGILLHGDAGSSSGSFPTDVFICKTNNDTLGFAIIGAYYSGGTDYKRFWVLDYEQTINITEYISDSSSSVYAVNSALSPWRSGIQCTSFAKIPCRGCNSHLEGVYQMVYNQYYNVYGTITDADGNKFYSNGALALAE